MILKQVDEVFVSLGYLILCKADWNKSFFSKKAERIFRPSKPVMGNKLKIPVRRFTRPIVYIMNGLKKVIGIYFQKSSLKFLIVEIYLKCMNQNYL